MGEIAKKYLSLGGENSWLGKAVQNQVQQSGGFLKQLFKNGYIVWNNKATAYQVGNGKPNVTAPSSIPDAYVNTSKDWRAEVYKWDRGSELKPPGKLGDATHMANLLGAFNLGSNSQKGVKFDWGNGSPNGNSKFPADNFVLKTYTDTDFEANKTYKFSARGDDGFRLFARPLNKPDAWELITPITDTSLNPDTRPWWQERYGNPEEYEFKPKDGGTYRVVALFYDRDSNANFDLSWKEVAPPSLPVQPSPITQSPLLTQQGAQYFKERPQFYGASGNGYAETGYGSSLNGTNAYREGNCTWYAYGRLKELGFNPENIMNGYPNANKWGEVLRNEASIVSSPQPGDVAQWYLNGQNHVAIVEKVEGHYIWISESQAYTDYDGNLPGSEIYPGAGTLHRVVKYTKNVPERYIRLQK